MQLYSSDAKTKQRVGLYVYQKPIKTNIFLIHHLVNLVMKLSNVLFNILLLWGVRGFECHFYLNGEILYGKIIFFLAFI